MAEEKTAAQMPDKSQTPQTRAAAASQFIISGAAGYPFNIRGKSFGAKKGTVIVSGRQVEITRWDDSVIKGYLPEDVKPGEVVVMTSEGQQQKGMFA